jgi:hypothetical protein
VPREQAGPARFPYPHSRNDCDACRERDADGELRENPARPSRLCRTCIGNYIAWSLVAVGESVTIYPLSDDRRVYGPNLDSGPGVRNQDGPDTGSYSSEGGEAR